MYKTFVWLLLVTNSLAVDIVLLAGSPTGPHGAQRTVLVEAWCPDQPPGVCCRAPEEWALPWVNGQQPDQSRHRGTTAEFTKLSPGDIAAVWQLGSSESRGTDYVGCSSTVVGSQPGPGRYQYTVDPPAHPAFGGASYITLTGVQFPPDAQTAKWLLFEGVLGLVWGGTQWFGTKAARDRYGGTRSVPKNRRERFSTLKGTVIAQQPPRWVDPAYIIADNVTYTYRGEGDLIYKDADGVTFNLTASRPKI